jgi:hypothetical protein
MLTAERDHGRHAIVEKLIADVNVGRSRRSALT